MSSEDITRIWEKLDAMAITLATVKTDVEWLKRNHFIVFTACVGAVFSAIGTFVFVMFKIK